MQQCFRAVLFRMVPKLIKNTIKFLNRFRAVLFRMVPKQRNGKVIFKSGFRAVLFRMVPKRLIFLLETFFVLELCCFEWFQNSL